MTSAGAKVAPRRRRPYATRLPAAERREQLLDAALCIIVRDGYRAVSIDAIAREAGVTRPVVYNIFDDLRALLIALLDRQEQRALSALLATVGRFDLSRPDAVAPMVQALIDLVRGDPETWHPIFATFTQAPTEVRARIDHDREVVRVRFRAMLEQAGLRRGVDADAAAHALVAIGQYFAELLLTRPDAVDPDALARTVAATIGRLAGPRPRG